MAPRGFLEAEVVPGVAFSVPAGFAVESADALHALNVSGLRGAEVVLQKGAAGPHGQVFRAACVRAPSSLWAPGLEELVFGQATWMSVGAMEREGFSAIHLEGKAMEHGAEPPGTYTQAVWGTARGGDGDVFMAGRHWLGFTGDARDALVCTLLCRSPEAFSCEQSLVAVKLAGPGLVAEPSPSLWIRLIMLSAEHPVHAPSAAGLVGLLLVAWLLSRRPHPSRYAPPKKAVSTPRDACRLFKSNAG